MNRRNHTCGVCGKKIKLERESYAFEECGIPHLVLEDVEVSGCSGCGNKNVLLMRLTSVLRTIALALVNSPRRLTGPQFRFLRKHLDMSGEELARLLHTDKTKISKWETGADPIGPSTDRLLRLLAVTLDGELSAHAAAVARNFPNVSDESGEDQEIRINAKTLLFAYTRYMTAA